MQGNPDTGMIVSLFGRIQINNHGQDLPILNHKARAMIALLCLSEGWEISRGSLCTILWPDSEPVRARASLRQSLKRLKTDLGSVGDEILHDVGDRVCLAQQALTSAHSRILEQLDQGIVPDILFNDEPVIDTFLMDLDGLAPNLDTWVAVQRRLFQDKLEQLLSDLLSETSTARLAARALIKLDPTNEKACRELMRLYAEEGETAAALRVYNQLYHLLDAEFDVEPVQETMDLAAEIKLGNIPTAQSGTLAQVRSAAPGDDRPTIMLVPARSISHNQISIHTKMFSQDLLTILVRFREWVLLEGAAGQDSPNHYLLECVETILPNEEVSLTVILKKSGSGQYLWSEKLNLSHESWASNHLRIARRLASAIDNNISHDRLKSMDMLVPQNQGVFDRWLYCQYLNSAWKPDAGRKIPEILHGIIEDEPLFAPAHAELAANYNSRHIFFPGKYRNPESREKALYHSKIALQIDPLETRSQRVMAWTYLMHGEYGLSEIHFNHALEMNACNPFTMISSAQGLAFCGKTKRAIDLAETVQEFQPVLPGFLQGYLVGINFLHGRLEEAIDAAENAGDSIANLAGWKASALWHSGQYNEARETAQKMAIDLSVDWSGDGPMTKAALADWFIDSFPINNSETRDRLDIGFRSALEIAN